MNSRRIMRRGRHLLLLRHDNNHHSVMLRKGSQRIYLGELIGHDFDPLHAFLCEPGPPYVEAWEPQQPYPFKTQHHAFDTEIEAVDWLIKMALLKGRL